MITFYALSVIFRGMEYPRFYCADQWPESPSTHPETNAGTNIENTTFELPHNIAKHAGRVLRMQPGDTIHLFNDSGAEWSAKISTADKNNITVRFISPIIRDNEAPFRTSILQAVSRGDRMDYTVQKSTEMGMTDFYPLITERVGVKMDAKRWAKKVQHWQAVAISACEQCGRQRVPTIHPVIKYVDALNLFSANGHKANDRKRNDHEAEESNTTKLMLEINAEKSLNAALPPNLENMALLIGPEGDFSTKEIDLAKQAGFLGIHIGPRILRTETVAPTVLAGALVLRGDWQ